MKTALTVLIFITIWLGGCVFVYNTGNSNEFHIDDNDTPDIKADVPLK